MMKDPDPHKRMRNPALCHGPFQLPDLPLDRVLWFVCLGRFSGEGRGFGDEEGEEDDVADATVAEAGLDDFRGLLHAVGGVGGDDVDVVDGFFGEG